MIKFDKNSEIIKTLMDYKSAFCALAVFSGVINFMMLIPSIYMMQVYDRVLSSKSETTLLMITLITAVLYSFMHVLEWVRSMVLVKISTGLDMKLNYRIFNVSFENTLRKGNANPSQVMADLATIRQFVTGNGLLLCSMCRGYRSTYSLHFVFIPSLDCSRLRDHHSTGIGILE